MVRHFYWSRGYRIWQGGSEQRTISHAKTATLRRQTNKPENRSRRRNSNEQEVDDLDDFPSPPPSRVPAKSRSPVTPAPSTANEGWTAEDEAFVESMIDVSGDEPSTSHSTTTKETPAPAYTPPTLEERVAALPQLYTSSSILELNGDHLNKFYQIESNSRTHLSSFAPKDELTSTDYYLMYRPSHHSLFHKFNSIHTPTGYYRTRKPYILHGPNGSGRTTTLFAAATWAKAKGWLVVEIIADSVSHDQIGEIHPSSNRPGIMDQPKFTAHWFKQILNSQTEICKKFKLSQNYDQYDWTKLPPDNSTTSNINSTTTTDPSSTPTDNATPPTSSTTSTTRTLYDMLTLGSLDTTQSPTILYDFITELRLNPPTNPSILVLIDNINVWSDPSDFVDLTNHYKPLPSKRLAVADALSTFSIVAPSNGVSMMSTCNHASTDNYVELMNLRRVEITQLSWYSNKQVKHALLHYYISGLLFSKINKEFIHKIKGLSGGLPKEILKLSQLL